MPNRIKAISLTVGIILLGFLREYLFANINWIYLTLTNGRMNSAREEFHFLLNWSPTEINILKFSLTALFCFLFFAFTYLIIKYFFNQKEYNNTVIITYISLLSIAVLLLGFGKATDLYSSLYGAIRTIMGIAQSFMPLMILALVFNFLPHIKDN